MWPSRHRNGPAVFDGSDWIAPAELARTLRVVAIGGGTGLAAPLRGLKSLLFPRPPPDCSPADRDRLTAIVTVADDGGSSGRLRRAYRMLPPGDIRNCLVALSDADTPLNEVFNFRFSGEADVGGHSLGNLIIAALAEADQDFSRGVERASQLLAIRGRVLPSTHQNVELVAEYDDGSEVAGESSVASAGRPIRRVRLEPEDVQPTPAAIEAIERADLVVLGPGSLYTSVLPVVLVSGIAEALRRSHAVVVLALNLMTEPGETDGYTALDMVRAVRSHAPKIPLHVVLFNAAPIGVSTLERYRRDGAVPVHVDPRPLRKEGCLSLAADLVAPGELVRHHPENLARALLALGLWWRGWRPPLMPSLSPSPSLLVG